MWKTITLWVFLAIIPASASAWFHTAADTAETRYPNGQRHEQYQRVVVDYEGGMKHGFYRSWYENGQLEWDGQYESSDKNGTWVHWDSAGSRIEEIPYFHGLKHGTEVAWNPNGTQRAALHYRNDKLHGLCIWKLATNSINGEYNDPCGSISAQRFYVDGVMLLPMQDSTDKPCMDGLVGGKEPYHNVENDMWIEWDRGNSHFFVGRQVEGKKHGVWIQWSADGDMEQVEVYDNGRKLTF